MLNADKFEFTKSHDLDSDFTHLRLVEETGDGSILSLREFIKLDSTGKDYIFKVIDTDSTHVRCATIKNSVGYINPDDKDSFYINSRTLLRNLHDRNKLIIDKLDKDYLKVLEGSLLKLCGSDVEDKYLFQKFFRCLSNSASLYVAEYLNISPKLRHNYSLHCDKTVGRFSTTYKVEVEFNGHCSVQSVVVNSNNLCR